MLNWGTLGEEKFNRAAEMLIMRTVEADNPGLKVTAVDGRGGDGGIDLDVTVRKTGQLITIYQLKHFPEGFSGAWAKARKPQIQKSYAAAVKHDPEKWVLVMPRNFSPKERSFVTALRGKSSRPRIERIGVTELDLMLARFPEVEDYINRDANRAALGVVRRESALLAKPEDLSTEVEQLQKRIAARSPYWGVNFGRVGPHYFEQLVAMRPDAAEREPLSFTLATDFTNEEALGEDYKRALDYGLLKPLQLPADVVTHFERHGPEWFAGVIDVLGVDLFPTGQNLDVPIKVILRSAEGKTIAQPTVVNARASSGQRGGQLNLLVLEGVEFTFVFDNHVTDGGNLNFEVGLQGLTGTAAKRATNFLKALSQARELTLQVGDFKPFTVTFEGQNPEPPTTLVELAADLAFIEDELGVQLSFPETAPSNYERIWIRVIRRVFEGAVSYVPGAEDLSFTVTAPVPQGVKDWLTADSMAFGIHVDDWEWEVLGQKLVVGDVSLAVFDGHVVDGPEHLEALETDATSSRIVKFAPNDATGGVLIYALNRRKPDEVIDAIPWGLAGVPEHRHFREPGAADEGDVDPGRSG